MSKERTIVVLANDWRWDTTVTILLEVDISPEDAETVFGNIGWTIEGIARGRLVDKRGAYDANQLLQEFASTKPEFTPDEHSAARVRAMELGLSPWPSASGWAPMDLPWKERRILIGIVEGVASLARWAHEIWLREHQPFW